MLRGIRAVLVVHTTMLPLVASLHVKRVHAMFVLRTRVFASVKSIYLLTFFVQYPLYPLLLSLTQTTTGYF
jgi:hypothetical protein